MAKASKHKVEAAEAVSAFSNAAPLDPECATCAFCKVTAHGLACGVKLPPWVKRSERVADNLVRPTDACDLYTLI